MLKAQRDTAEANLAQVTAQRDQAKPNLSYTQPLLHSRMSMVSMSKKEFDRLEGMVRGANTNSFVVRA